MEGIEAAKAEAKKTLPDGDRRDFVVVVKDEAGRELLRITLSLAVESFF